MEELLERIKKECRETELLTDNATCPRDKHTSNGMNAAYNHVQALIEEEQQKPTHHYTILVAYTRMVCGEPRTYSRNAVSRFGVEWYLYGPNNRPAAIPARDIQAAMAAVEKILGDAIDIEYTIVRWQPDYQV